MPRGFLFAMFTLALSLAAPALARQPQPGQRPAGGPGGGGQGRRGVEALTVSMPSWPDGGMIPSKFSQVGDEVSPAITWSAAPEGTMSFVVIAHDVDATVGAGTDDMLHWMVWNIPPSSRGLAEGQPSGNQWPDGSRQISATGPYFRGPGALAAGPMHHYVFEVYALDTMLDVPAVGASPPLTRAAVMAAMAGHVRGKGSYVGLFKR